MNRSLLSAALLGLSLISSSGARAGWVDDPLAAGYTSAGFSSEACPKVASGASLTLTDAVDRALCANPKTLSAWAAARASAAQVGVAKSAYLPTVTGTLGQSRTLTDSQTANQLVTRNSTAQLALSYLLLDFGGRAATLNVARQQLLAAQASQDATLQATFLAVVQNYFNVWAAQESVRAAEQAVAAASASLSVAQGKFEVGSITRADMLQAKTALAQAKLNLESARGALQIARGQLANVLNVSPQTAFVLAPAAQRSASPEELRRVDDLMEEAAGRRPDVRAALSQVEAAKAQVTVAKSAGLPTLSLGVSGNSAYSSAFGNSSGNTVGLTLTIPVFTGFKTHYNIAAAEAQVASQEAALAAARSQVELDVWTAYQNLSMNIEALKAADEGCASAQESFDLALGRYKAGVGTFADVLNAQSALAQSNQNRISSLGNLRVARFALAQSIGGLDASFLASQSKD